jgi:hypothetical protein
MTEVYVITAAVLVLSGAVLGFVAVISLAIHRDKDITMPATSRLVRGSRVATGQHRRGMQIPGEVAYHHLPPRTDRGR